MGQAPASRLSSRRYVVRSLASGADESEGVFGVTEVGGYLQPVPV